MPEHTGEGEIKDYEAVNYPISPDLKEAIALAEAAAETEIEKAGLTTEERDELDRLKRDLTRHMFFGP